MVACSVVCTVFILNFHERTVDTHEVGVRNLKNHMKTLSFFSDASLGGVYFPPVVALASQDGSTRTTLDCKVNPAQVFNSFRNNRFCKRGRGRGYGSWIKVTSQFILDL